MINNPGTPTDSFELNFRFRHALSQKLLPAVKAPLERLLSLRHLHHFYTEIAGQKNGDHLVDRALAGLNVSYGLSAAAAARIPATGPCVVVANHPFGAIEGLALASLLRSLRPDVKVMANYLLGRIPELRDLLILVDPFGKAGSAQSNIRGVKEAISWIKGGGMLVAFPAGEVAHASLPEREITDPPWSETIARLVRICAAPVLPVFFPGTNSLLFHAAGLVHPQLRTALLPHELLNKRNRRLEMRIGKTISYGVLAGFASDAEMTAYLRQRTFVLRHCKGDRAGGGSPPASFGGKPSAVEERRPEPAGSFIARLRQGGLPRSGLGRAEPIAAPIETRLLLQDLRLLPARQVLIESGDHVVFYASAAQIPQLLQEIGRQREIAFRQVGEGTGRPLDLDEFDQYYAHLCLWNTRRDELVGAYRLGRADEIVRQRGIAGLYTRTLFEYDGRLLADLGPALELGRSFVKPEHQRTPMPLFLLWKGIGQYLVRFPHYRTLFGPVSISSEYDPVSQQMMIEFLKGHGYTHELANRVKAKTPFVGRPVKGWDSQIVPGLEELATVISEVESNQKSIPVLLKEYLRLGGKLLAFNVDPHFNNSLDGLIVVDLTQTPRRVLGRYMGEDGLAAFLSYHQRPAAAEACAR